jgi:hypothetical protein
MRWLILLAGLVAAPAWAGLPAAVPSPFAQCDAAIAAAAKLPGRVPRTLLPAIARVESGRLDPATGKVRPWPWTINVDGTGYFYDSKDAVIAAVKALQAKGKRSIDVGCMQVNLMHHPKAFAGLEEAFDPVANARYAVRFLVALYAQTKNWPLATAYYHSSTPDLGEEYQRLVFGRVLTPMGGTKGVAGLWPTSEQRYAAIPPMSFTYRAFAPRRQIKPMFGGIPVLPIGTFAPLSSAKPFGASR